MGRSTYMQIDHQALKHNLKKIKQLAFDKKIIAMVKANAYGCRLDQVIPTLQGEVYAWGVACLKEALALRALDKSQPCILFQGIFSPDEISVAVQHDLQLVINHPDQVTWLVECTDKRPIKIWLDIDTGMHRVGLQPLQLSNAIERLNQCAHLTVLGLMTHMGYADEPERLENVKQIEQFMQVKTSQPLLRSMANSAAIMAFPGTHLDVVRPGLMLYGASPFAEKTAKDLGLLPVMHLYSSITAIYDYPANTPIGYSGIYTTLRNSRIGILSIGYGDGYPRTIEGAEVWLHGQYVPVVGRVSMDMLAIDLTDCPTAQRGDKVELWGSYVAVEKVAQLVGTTAYELLCKVTERTYLDVSQ